jgi:tellurite resistance protein TerC
MTTEALLLSGFLLFVITMLLLDLLVVGRKTHVIRTREALMWTSVWVALALLFYFFLSEFGHLLHGIDTPEKLAETVGKYSPELIFSSDSFEAMLSEYRRYMGISYLAGYFIEETLSIDNIFVMLILLQGFGVAPGNYKKVLFWGILGAIVLRFIFIFAGSALIRRFEWILIVFGVFLIYQSIHILISKNHGMRDPRNHPVVVFLSKKFRVLRDFAGGKFWIRSEGRLYFTPLFVVLVMIEFTDLLFAFDSIPAVFAISRDPYIVFFSNIFAIIGLRSLFFLLAGLVEKFRFLKAGVSALLAFVGLKLVFHSYLEKAGFESWYSLVIIGSVLLISILSSILFPAKKDVTDSTPSAG